MKLTPTLRRTLRQVTRKPGSTVADLGRALHLPHATAYFHVYRLEKGGHIRTERTREGRSTIRRCYLPEAA